MLVVSNSLQPQYLITSCYCTNIAYACREGLSNYTCNSMCMWGKQRICTLVTSYLIQFVLYPAMKTIASQSYRAMLKSISIKVVYSVNLSSRIVTSYHVPVPYKVILPTHTCVYIYTWIDKYTYEITLFSHIVLPVIL